MGTSLETLETIAGRMQAQSSNVGSMTFAETMAYMHEKVRTMEDMAGLTRNALLHQVYEKTGKTVAVDGTAVCGEQCMLMGIGECVYVFACCIPACK